MERRFECTACGKCCTGQLPLTLADAMTHAGRFPLALLWTPVPKGAGAHGLGAQLGVSIRRDKRTQMAVIVGFASYLPPSFPCPELSPDGRCRIHADKPSRCRAMPFYPYRDEADQAEFLVPRKDWACNTSATAPVVYRNHRIVDRTDFDFERRQLTEQVPTLRHYADYVLRYMPWIVDSLQAVAGQAGGQVVTSLSSFLTATRMPGAASMAAKQLPLLKAYADKTAGDSRCSEFHRHYSGWAVEMEYLARSSTD
jgi:Fe-S-cluster containining protein